MSAESLVPQGFPTAPGYRLPIRRAFEPAWQLWAGGVGHPFTLFQRFYPQYLRELRPTVLRLPFIERRVGDPTPLAQPRRLRFGLPLALSLPSDSLLAELSNTHCPPFAVTGSDAPARLICAGRPRIAPHELPCRHGGLSGNEAGRPGTVVPAPRLLSHFASN